jgi:hypothetical protein
VQQQFGRDEHTGRGSGVRFARNRSAQPDDEAVVRSEPPDHEEAHVTGGVRVDFAA